MSTASRAIRARFGPAVAFAAVLAFGACTEEPAAPVSPLIPPEPPDNPQILSAAWTMDVNRLTGKVRITPPKKGLNASDLQVLADYFGVEPGSPDLSILAGDVIEINTVDGTFSTSAVGAFIPGFARTTFEVTVRNKLTGANIVTPTFPAPPPGTEGILLFPFEIVVTETPGGATGGLEDGTVVVVELPNGGAVAPSTNWDVAPHNFFNDSDCPAGATDCYRSEPFAQPLLGGATSAGRQIGFDHEPTVVQFRVRMILAGDLQDATPNTPPTAEAGGPYTGARGVAITLAGSGTDPDAGGSIASFAWDYDADGQFDDATGATPTFTCPAGGAVTLTLRVVDNRGAGDTDDATVTCTDAAPTAEAGGPYTGFIGTPITLAGSGTDDGTIASFAWDLDNDGAFDDSALQNPSFTCTATAAATVRLQVRDDAAQTDDDNATVNCSAAADGVVNGRWVNTAGAPITTVAAGATVRLQLDANMGTNGIDLVDATLNYSSALASATASADLTCNVGSSCPSGTGNQTDRLTTFTGNTSNAGAVLFSNFSTSGNGTGIQGFAEITFTVSAAGTLSPTLSPFTAAANGGATTLNLSINIPALTITP
jgi:hypothetical protein